jgi:Pyruvate/2-oxoacid:ferredoxin oxidoreductase delta subunit
MGSVECSHLCGGEKRGCSKEVFEMAMKTVTEILLRIKGEIDVEEIKNMNMNQDQMMKKFRVHERLKECVNYVMTEFDWNFVVAAEENGMIPETSFSKEELERGYKRGVLNKEKYGDRIIYKLGTFHKRIDCFLRGERELFEALPPEIRSQIVEYEQDIQLWVIPYREEGKNMSIVHPVPLERALEIVENSDSRFWVQQCDCKAYRRETKHLTETCLHLMTEENRLNSNFDRGYGRELTKEETKQLLVDIDKDGLVHNYEGNSFCNCCDCCCWALRGMETYRKLGYDVFSEYVNAEYIIDIDEEKCRGCNACAGICPGHALEIRGGKAKLLDDRCLGCGVCRNKCAFGALKIVKRDVR